MFTDSVKAVQEHYGTRRNYQRIEMNSKDRVFEGLGDVEKDFIESRDGFYIATVNEDGWPYIQFRGGPTGFLKVLDEKTVGYADFKGNLQYISVGNLSADNRAALFLMDYANQRRLKILVMTEVKDAGEAPELMGQLRIPGYKAKIERVMILRIEAFDWNCPQHITPRYTVEEIRHLIAPVYEKIESLEAENTRLKSRLSTID
jgi:predicted pyridoxine 5'-phosphate oxidase superfamily flavin-nucleotide-binding protein